MTRQQAKELIEARGFEVWAFLGTNEIQAMDKQGINLFVDWEKDKFRFMWLIPKDIIRMESPLCSPFTSNQHFEKIYKRFKKVVECYLTCSF